MKCITAFEHGWLEVGDGRDLSSSEADALALAEQSLPAGCLEWGRQRVKFKQFSGVVRLQQVQIEVLPKVFPHQTAEQQRTTLIDMLTVSGELEGLESLQAGLATTSHHLLDLFIRHFLQLLERQLQQGLLRGYQEVEETLDQVRGRIDLIRQQRENLFQPQRLACRFSELVADIPVNRLLNTALVCITGLVYNPLLRQQVLAMRQRFAGVGTLLLHEPAPRVVDLNRMQRRYAGVVAWAHLFLNGQYLDVRSGQQQAFSLLFDMNRLFERYTANRLRPLARRQGLRLMEQGPRRYLAEDEAGKARLLMRPDICLLDNHKRPQAILDTKWKLLTASGNPLASLSAADLYQISTYASAYHCGQVMLLYPEQQYFVKKQSLRLNLGNEARLSILPVPLDRGRSMDSIFPVLGQHEVSAAL